jgi:tRNA-modifying protein YgfZ
MTAPTAIVLGDDSVRGYLAIREGAMWVDRSARTRVEFTGPDVKKTITGLVTSDVESLVAGSGQYGAALTPKGKILADLRIFARDSGLLVDVPKLAAPGWWTMIRKYVNPRGAKYTDITASTRDVGVYGEAAASRVAAALGMATGELEGLAAYAHRTVTVDDVEVIVARVPDLRVPGFEIFAFAAEATFIEDRLSTAGAERGDEAVFTVASIEAGRPEWGIDIDDTTLAQEAELDAWHAISYTKGCYTGQETVARIHFRGHVNKQLRGLRVDPARLPPTRAELIDATGRIVGDVRSVGVSPRLGGIALGMVRREVTPGTILTVRWLGAEGEATGEVQVEALPLVR